MSWIIEEQLEPEYKPADERPSAQAIGTFAILFVALELALMLAIDITSMAKSLNRLKLNLNFTRNHIYNTNYMYSSR